MIQVACPHCSSVFSTPATDAGREIGCPHCAGRLGVPSANEVPAAGLSVLCPHCRRVFQTSSGRPGDTISCPLCSQSLAIPGSEHTSNSGPKILLVCLLLLAAGVIAVWFALREDTPPVAKSEVKAASETTTKTADPKPGVEVSPPPPEAFLDKMKEAEAALAVGEADRARTLFQAAVRQNPQDRKADEMLKALENYQAARVHLATATDFLRSNDAAAVVAALTKAGELQTALRKARDNYASVQVLLDKSAFETETFFSQSLGRLDGPAKGHKEQADAAWRKFDYTVASKEYANAASELTKAKSMLPAFLSLASERRRPDIEQKEKELADQLAAAQHAARKSEGQSLVAKGQELLRKGKVQMVLAEEDGKAVFQAQTAFDGALKHFQEAGKFPETNAERHIDVAKKERRAADGFLQPVALDIASQKLPADWKFSKKQWAFLKKGERLWLQAAETREATLASPIFTMPKDFELELTLAMVNKNGDMQNDYWAHTPEALTITLAAKSGKDLVIALGKDPAIAVQNYTRLAVGKKTTDAQHIAASKEPIVLRLVKVKERASVSLGGRQDAIILPLSEDFNQFRLTLRNGFNTATNQYFSFPIVLGVSLKMHLEDGGAKTK